MTYYYIYKITCTAGSFKDHYYIGQRKCYCLPEEDPYKGSGRQIKDYYKKYPHDYKKEIICLCKDEDDLNQKEAFYIGDKYETDPKCLNLRAGGNQAGMSEETRKKMSDNHADIIGEKNPFYGKHHSEESRRKMSENNAMKRPDIRKKLSEALTGRTLSEETRKKISEHHADFAGEKHPFYGKHHSEETYKKMSEAKKDRKWMNNGLQEKYVKPDEVNLYIEKGYSFGRLKRI